MASEAELCLHRCCFTGHRPEKLKRNERDIKAALREQIDQAVDDGLTVFITGMARGVDLWSAEWKQLYNSVRDHADLVRIIGNGYHSGIYQVRNEWMVNHSARVIAVFNGQPSGTKNTIDYACRQGVPVVLVEG